MKIVVQNRGFAEIHHTTYPPGEKRVPTRLVSESSKIGDYSDSAEHPGSSYLWVGDNHHLNREEVLELVSLLLHWIREGHLPRSERGGEGNEGEVDRG